MILTETPAPEAAVKVTVAFCSLAVVMAFAIISISTVRPFLAVICVGAVRFTRLTSPTCVVSPAPEETTRFTALPEATLAAAAGFWLITWPAGTVALLWVVTVPTVRLAPVIAVEAAAWVMPTTFGTVTLGVVPVPEALTEPLPPSLVMLMLAVFAPVVAGAKVTLNSALPPGAIDERVAGENLNSVFEDEILVTLRVPVPVFDIVTVCAVEVVPAVWLPKVRVVGDTPRTGTGAVVPVPEALSEPLPPLLVMLMVALLAPVLPGLKARVNVWLAPAAMLNGVAGAVTAKSVALLLEMVLTVRAALPVLDMVTV